MDSVIRTPQTPDFGAILQKLAPRRFSRDFLGLFSGYRAYLVYTQLSSMSDADLEDLGIERDDIVQVATRAIFSEK